ncbi:aspartate aminotransferase family protein [Chloroflexota bacterium]
MSSNNNTNEKTAGQLIAEMGKYTIEELKDMYDQFSCQCDETGMYDKFLVVEKAEGLNVWFKGESEPYLDLVMGFSALNFGHQHPRLLKAVQKALNTIEHVHSFNSESKILLSRILAEKSPGTSNRKVYYPVGGAMAVETAIKLARAFTGKSKIASFNGAFHGYAYGAMMVTDDNVIDKKQFAPYPGEVVRLPYANCYRCESQAECDLHCLREAEQALSQDKDIAGLIVEPIQGHAGYIIPPKDFIVGLKKLCKDNGVVFIDDEIQVGMGRAGKIFAIEHFDVEPDIILMGKSLSGGYYPLSAVIARAEIWDCIPPKGSGIGSTFVNSPWATSVALEVMSILEEGYLQNSEIVGAYFTEELKKLERYENIDNVTGLGLSQSFEVVKSKETKEIAPEIAKAILAEALKRRVITYIAGINKSRIKFILPLWVTKEDIDMLIGKFTDIFEAVLPGN